MVLYGVASAEAMCFSFTFHRHNKASRREAVPVSFKGLNNAARTDSDHKPKLGNLA